MLIVETSKDTISQIPKRRVWKFYLGMGPEQTITLPKGAQVLSVGVQNDLMHLWALVDPDAPRVDKHFYVVATGEPCDYVRGMKFCGVAMMRDGALVFHVFEGSDEFEPSTK
jgi:hypothetical protein